MTAHTREAITRRITGLPRWARWAATPYPPGHYHSPLPDLALARALSEVERPPDSVVGIDTHLPQQLALLDEFADYYRTMPFKAAPTAGLRYFLDCTWFAHGDGIALYCMLRHLQPKRYIEIGSGYSSACALDTSERFLDAPIEFTFVEPNPSRLQSLLRSTDQVSVISDGRELTSELFAELDAGDVLFIDSSHIVKYGSEVNKLFLDILPLLRPGVHVHVHDIFWPFSYPMRWLAKGRAWNEAYLLRAWLCDNPHAKITWFNSYLAHAARNPVTAQLAGWGTDPGSSIWITTT